MLKLRTILLYDYLYIVLALLAIIYSLLITNFYHYNSKYNLNTNKITGYIDDIDINGDKLSIELEAREKILINYYFKTHREKDSFSLKLGDYISVVGTINDTKANTVFNLFNYKKYLSYRGIYKIFTATSIERTKENTRVKYKIKQIIMERIDKITSSNAYVRALMLGDMGGVDKDISATYQVNGVSHLFAISGSNITLLSVVLLFLLKKLKIGELKRYIIVIIFLIFYMFLTNYTGSVIRATIFFILLSFNQIYYFNIKTINILLLTLVVILMGGPAIIYDIGFQFSFIISLYLILFQSIITREKNYFIKTFIISIIAFLASIPICSYNFFQINLLSPFFNILFVPFVSFIIFPLSIITFIFPILDHLLFLLTRLMENISLLFSNIKIGQLVLSKPSLLLVLTYYFTITLSLIGLSHNKYHQSIYIILLLFFHHHINYFNNNPFIVFIDVGQGDSTLINLPHNKGTILIDTGGILEYSKEEARQKRNGEYSIAKNTIIPYLKSIGISSLDYLILTHGDFDHMGESINLIDKFKVKKVILNSGDPVSLEEYLIKKLKEKKISYFFGKSNDIIKLNGYSFSFLNPSIDENEENANSLVLYTILDNHKILLMGDAPVKIENKLINTYNLRNVDILKLGHHGSITSSSEMFLDEIKPKYGVIQVGLKNKFCHPSKIIMKRLKDRKIKAFLTSVNGTIRFNLKRSCVTIQTISS